MNEINSYTQRLLEERAHQVAPHNSVQDNEAFQAMWDATNARWKAAVAADNAAARKLDDELFTIIENEQREV